MIKEYLENEYKQAILSYKCTYTEVQRSEALKELAKIEYLMTREYGSKCTDEMRKLLKDYDLLN